MPPITAIVLNWNGSRDTIVCVESLKALEYPELDLVVVDNCSTDDSIHAIQAAFPDITLIINDTNLGYAGGNNVGIRHALQGPAEYILVINNDTRVGKGFLRELVTAGENHPKAGALIPKIYYWDDPTRVWAAGARWVKFPPRVKIIGLDKPDIPQYNQPRDLEYATGCAWLLRRKALEQLGGLDENYFMYQEDYDFCYRLTAAGCTLRYVPAAHMWHRVSTGLGIRSQRWWYHWSLSTIRFYRVDNRFPISWLFLFAGWAAAREVVRGRFRFFAPFIRGLYDGWRTLKES